VAPRRKPLPVCPRCRKAKHPIHFVKDAKTGERRGPCADCRKAKATKVKVSASLRSASRQAGSKAKLSKLKCEVCKERITQWAVNYGETRFCSLEHAILGGELEDVWGVWQQGESTPSQPKVEPTHPCVNPDCTERVRFAGTSCGRTPCREFAVERVRAAELAATGRHSTPPPLGDGGGGRVGG
jgi:hypothetical protein